MQMPNIIWPLSQLGTDVLHGTACTVFAIAHWVAVVTGNVITDDAILHAYHQEIAFRGSTAGLTVPEAIFAAHRAGWLPPGISLRRTHDLSRVVYGPMIATYRWRNGAMRTPPDGVIDNTGAVRGRHTVLILGWDGQHVVIANSFGADWGNNGIGRMPIAQHNDAVLEMYQIVVPGQPSTPQEAAQAASEAIPDELSDQVASVHRNLQSLGYPGLPTTAVIIMPDIIRRSMSGAFTPDQEKAKSNLAHVYTMLLLQGLSDAQINAIHTAKSGGTL